MVLWILRNNQVFPLSCLVDVTKHHPGRDYKWRVPSSNNLPLFGLVSVFVRCSMNFYVHLFSVMHVSSHPWCEWGRPQYAMFCKFPCKGFHNPKVPRLGLTLGALCPIFGQTYKFLTLAQTNSGRSQNFRLLVGVSGGGFIFFIGHGHWLDCPLGSTTLTTSIRP